MNRNTEGAVKLVFDRSEKHFGTCNFQTLFEYILTAKGSKFGNPESSGTGFTRIERTSIYYCALCSADRKAVWNKLIPCSGWFCRKKTNFEFLTRWDVNLIVSHIISTPGESLQGKTLYDVAPETLGEENLKAFQLRRITPDEVSLPQADTLHRIILWKNLLSDRK